MKKYIVIFLFFACTRLIGFSQSPIPPSDKSPMDMSYYPVNYPILKIQDKITEPLIARVIYSRPQKGGRRVFGELVEYGSVWRLGANEATEIEFFKDVIVVDKPVPKGRYTIYAVPATGKWIFIVNSETDTWGSFKYDSKKDVARVEVPAQKLNDPIESLAIYFDKAADGFVLNAAWENEMVSVPMKVAERPAGKASTKPPAKKAR